MKQLKKIGLFLLLVCTMTGMGTICAFAKTKINSVSIKVESSIEPDTEYGKEEIDVTVKTGKCTFMDYEILNDDNEWSLNMVPKIQVVLEANDDYYFSSSLTASNIKIAGGTYISATRAESSTQLKITMTLPSLMTFVGEMGEVRLNQSGIASWDPVMGAAEYYIRLYRDGSSVNTSVTTRSTSYDFSPAMLRSGSYTVRVRAVNGVDSNNRSENMDSNPVSINDEIAADNRQNNSNKPGEWIQDEVGWWYSRSDGGYTVSGWEQIHGSWYLFDESGYMRTGWVSTDGNTYYFNPENGKMISNATIENRLLGDDGAMIQ